MLENFTKSYNKEKKPEKCAYVIIERAEMQFPASFGRRSWWWWWRGTYKEQPIRSVSETHSNWTVDSQLSMLTRRGLPRGGWKVDHMARTELWRGKPTDSHTQTGWTEGRCFRPAAHGCVWDLFVRYEKNVNRRPPSSKLTLSLFLTGPAASSGLLPNGWDAGSAWWGSAVTFLFRNQTCGRMDEYD